MSGALLQKLPSPLVNDITGGRCLPIVGAGLSVDATTSTGVKLPTWKELGSTLESQLSLVNQGDGPIDAISAYEQDHGRVRLVEELRRQLCHGKASPSLSQLAFCRLPFDIVCTTNWDTLLERSYLDAGRETYVIVDEQQLPIGVDPEMVTLLKLHGDLDHPHRLVATENDYDRFIHANPLLVTYFTNLLITRTPLFIGYSLNDPDLRQIMSVVRDRLGTLARIGYVLSFDASNRDRANFDRRNVRCVDLA